LTEIVAIHLEKAKNHVIEAEGDSHSSEAQQAIAHALIALIEQLKIMGCVEKDNSKSHNDRSE
jgi:hypothetical protein